MTRQEWKIRLLLNILKEISERYDEILEENKKLLEQLHREATTDQLTGLLNRKALLEELKKEIAKIKRHNKETLCLCFVDMDFFKKINDTYGHAEGDKVLKEFAKILKSNVRVYDIVGRWGGDEFILGIINCEYFNDPKVCKKCPIFERISKNVKALGNKYNIPLNVSCGVAKIPSEVKDLEKALQLADKRLYTAKKLGKGRVIVD
ncbi:MAG TPA: GGDEF domain-containing protein [Aquifex aeolicus]|uniref:diguanylate cyclase n=1 Tax=Aquifex aeolicus TaxID=63363 RepID=A0A9D0YS42_AQUAO|nr:GGDEF domain-containing protein [Aquificales bacterium]HIP98717.1 GGDEF domain-containing protein [Aquifex aeolicus]HIQ25906.1 GGDEF domain-containing protein [Aquifex aeolicus]